MTNISLKHKIVGIIVAVSFFPFGVSAQTNNSTCSSVGYSVVTINGMLTDKVGADYNRRALEDLLDATHNNEPITVDFLLNPSHVAGLGDIFAVAYQKYFDTETVKDYDLVNILNDASAKVKTQKLLLVAHSQGNFYANSFYDTVADKIGGVPAGSIGVYGVASPSSRTAGNGKYMTSSTDTVIEKLRWKGILSIIPANEDIKLSQDDTSNGHGFSDVYLKYRGGKIVSDIQSSLDKLSSDPERREDIRCIDPPKLTIVHKVVGAALYIADPVANVGKVAVAGTYNASVFVVKTTANVAIWTANTTAKVAVWYVDTAVDLFVTTYNTGVNVAIWAYQTGTVFANMAYSTVLSIINNTTGSVGNNNSASVMLAIQKVETAPSVTAVAKKPAIALISTKIIPNPVVVNVSMDSVKTSANTTKLVFVGNFVGGGRGGGGSSQVLVLGASETATPVDETATTTEEVLESTGAALAAPVLTPHCAFAIATSTDGCLIATTTVRFDWLPTDASHYSIIKNGILATTTELSFETTALDFSDYTFEIASVDNLGITSSSTKKTISVATIPIAINEIAWMGTRASTNDEWIELKNNTGYAIDLSQWVLTTRDNILATTTPHIVLNGTIAPYAYLVLGRTDNTTTSVVAHAIYTGALSNSGEQLSLLRSAVLFDQTPIGAWPAGENTSSTTRKTMERYSSKVLGTDVSNWGTWGSEIEVVNATDAEGNEINGTPGARNSTTYLLNRGLDITSDLTINPDEDYYLIIKQLTVIASSTFTLEPGVVIKFLNTGGGTPTLVVLGALHATGDAENPVVFESYLNDQSGEIEFIGGTSASTFDHVKIESIEGIWLIDGTHLSVKNSVFINNYYGVGLWRDQEEVVNGKYVFTKEGSTLFVENTSFASTTKEAISAYDGSFVSLASSTITNTLSSDAIGIYDSTFVMTSSEIDGVARGSGIYADNSTIYIASSTFRNILEGDGIYLYYATSTITNTVIENTGISKWGNGIEISGGTASIASSTISGFIEGAGIDVYLPAGPVVIENSEITGNTVGLDLEYGSATCTNVSVYGNIVDIIGSNTSCKQTLAP